MNDFLETIGMIVATMDDATLELWAADFGLVRIVHASPWQETMSEFRVKVITSIAKSTSDEVACMRAGQLIDFGHEVDIVSGGIVAQ